MKTETIFSNADSVGFSLTGGKRTLVDFINGTIECGFASPANDYIHSQIDIADLLIDNANATYVIQAQGVSMVDAGIETGDYLIIERGKEYQTNDIAVCCVNGEYTVKRVIVQGENARLIPANANFNEIILSEGDDLTVWGLVKWILKKR